MARGKQAVEAARRREDALVQTIDRLTEQLAGEKLRRKEAEVRAAQLEGLDLMARNAELRNDKLLSDALDALRKWKHSAADDRERRKKALGELWLVARDLDLAADLVWVDMVEFLDKRYPAVMDALCGGVTRDSRIVAKNSRSRSFERKLSADELRRFQRYIGERGTPEWDSEADMSQVWCDLLDARNAGFEKQEIAEYVGLPPADRR